MTEGTPRRPPRKRTRKAPAPKPEEMRPEEEDEALEPAKG